MSFSSKCHLSSKGMIAFNKLVSSGCPLLGTGIIPTKTAFVPSSNSIRPSRRESHLKRLLSGLQTLKAFANSSPGLRFGNPGNTHSFLEDATLKELRRGFVTAKLLATPSDLRRISCATFNPGFQSKPWAGVRQRPSALFPEFNKRLQRYFAEFNKRLQRYFPEFNKCSR